MSNELMIILATASVAALIGGALGAWLIRRRSQAPIPELEGRHELQLLELREAVVRYQQESSAAEHQRRTERTELENALGHISALEEQVAAYIRKYAQAKNTLKAEIRLKSRLQTELAAAGVQIDSLQSRVQELELEHTAITGTLRRLRA